MGGDEGDTPAGSKIKEKRESNAEREKSKMAEEMKARKEEGDKLAKAKKEEDDRLVKEAAEADAKKVEAARLKKEEADAKKAEASAKKAEASAKKAEADAKRKAAEEKERKRLEEEERKRKAAEEKERKRLEEEERKRKAAEEKERKRLEEEERKRLEAEAGQGLILDPKLKTELPKLKPKSEFTQEVQFHFKNETDEPLTYYMISPDDPRANIFELPPQTSFKETFSVANPWIILRNNSTPIAAYDAYSSTLPTQLITLTTDKSKKTTSSITSQDLKSTSQIPHDPRIEKADFQLIMTEDLQESFVRETQTH